MSREESANPAGVDPVMTRVSEVVNCITPQVDHQQVRKDAEMVFIGWVRFDSFPDNRINAMCPLSMGMPPNRIMVIMSL